MHIKLRHSLAFMTTLIITPASAHLAIDHLKNDLRSRFEEVKDSEELTPQHKAKALEQIRALEAEYTSMLSYSSIPSQKQTAEDIRKKLNREIESFDKNLRAYKTESTATSNKSKK